MADLLQRIGRAQRVPMWALDVDRARAVYEAGAEVLDLPREAVAEVRELVPDALPGWPAPGRLYRPHRLAGPAQPALLYLHGGGFVVGSLETHDALCRQLALRSGAAVVALDYRRAPEHPFPAAWDDAWAALSSLHAHAAQLGLDPQRLAIAGDSAGGTLAGATALRARDQGLPLRAQVLITPGTAAHAAGHASRHTYASGFLLDELLIEWFFSQLLPAESRGDPRFALLEAEPLEGVAEALFVLAECDPLVDEGIAYADRLRLAGVPVQLDLVHGVTHDWIKMGRALPEAAQAQATIGEFLSERLGSVPVKPRHHR